MMFFQITIWAIYQHSQRNVLKSRGANWKGPIQSAEHGVEAQQQ